MVKLKIQSAEDIIAAFINRLGCSGEQAPQLLAAYPQLSRSNSIISELNHIICRKARKIFGGKLAEVQLVALYKALYIENNMAEKYGITPLLPEFSDCEFAAQMQASYFEPAPDYKLTAMPTQEITTIQLHKDKD